MVACQLPKLNARVRFPLPAALFLRSTRDMLGPDLGRSDLSRGCRRSAGARVEGLRGVLEHLGLLDAHVEHALGASFVDLCGLTGHRWLEDVLDAVSNDSA